MKIEKINDKQIRCTLNRADLDNRNLLLSELAYGSQKAKTLFQDLMQKASNELGFEAQDTPLMIEAIPVSADCLVLIVTKVDEPDELDTRFSRFSSGDFDDYLLDFDDMEEIHDEYDEESSFDSYFSESNLAEEEPAVYDLTNVTEQTTNSTNLNDFVPLKEAISHTPFIQSLKEKKEEEKEAKRLFHVISFTNFNILANAAASLGKNYPGDSMLYKNPVTSSYYLVVYRGNQDSSRYHHGIHVLCEYGKLENTSFGSLAYYNEHFKPMILKNAVNILSKLA